MSEVKTHKPTVVCWPIWGSKYYTFVGHHNKVGGVFIDHEGRAHVFPDIEKQDVEDLRIEAGDGGMAFDEEFDAAWSDTGNFHTMKAAAKINVSGSKRVEFALTQDEPIPFLRICLGPHLYEEGDKEYVRGDEKRFPSELAVFLLPANAPDSLVTGLRSILKEQRIPWQFVTRKSGKSRMVTVAEFTSATFTLDMEVPLESKPSVIPKKTTQDDKTKPEVKIEVYDMDSALGEEPEQPEPEVIKVGDLPSKTQNALEKKQRHTQQLFIEGNDTKAILVALIRTHATFASSLEVPLRVMLPRYITNERGERVPFPSEITKLLIQAGIDVANASPQTGKVGVMIE